MQRESLSEEERRRKRGGVTYLVHGEESSAPVQGTARLPQLVVYPITFSVDQNTSCIHNHTHTHTPHTPTYTHSHSTNLLLLPLPHFLNKLLSANVVSRQSSLPHQLLLNHHLSGYASMVAPRHPHHSMTLHTMPGVQRSSLLDTRIRTYNSDDVIILSQPTHHLTMESSMALVRAWPRWRVPVTLGGGRVMMNDPLGLTSPTL